MKYLCLKLEPELQRHLEKYALYTKQSVKEVCLQAIKNCTRYNEMNLVIKAFPRKEKPPIATEELEKLLA